MRVRTIVSSLLAAAALAVGGVAVAPTASAAPTCTGNTRYTKLWQGTTVYYWKPTTTAGSGNINCILGVGSTGDGVGTLQTAANQCYSQGLAVDSNYGAATQQAVRNIQNFHGLPVDGTFGPQTSNGMVWPKYNGWGYFIDCWI